MKGDTTNELEQNKDVTDFVYSSNLFKKIRDVQNKSSL